MCTCFCEHLWLLWLFPVSVCNSIQHMTSYFHHPRYTFKPLRESIKKYVEAGIEWLDVPKHHNNILITFSKKDSWFILTLFSSVYCHRAPIFFGFVCRLLALIQVLPNRRVIFHQIKFGNYSIFTVGIVIYHYVERIGEFSLTPVFCITDTIIKNSTNMT